MLFVSSKSVLRSFLVYKTIDQQRHLPSVCQSSAVLGWARRNKEKISISYGASLADSWYREGKIWGNAPRDIQRSSSRVNHAAERLKVWRSRVALPSQEMFGTTRMVFLELYSRAMSSTFPLNSGKHSSGIADERLLGLIHQRIFWSSCIGSYRRSARIVLRNYKEFDKASIQRTECQSCNRISGYNQPIKPRRT